MTTTLDTGTTVANEVRKEKSKNYWTADTEQAIREFLNLDVVFLERKLTSYLKERGELDETIDDGYVAELEYQIERAYSPEIQHEKERIFRKKIEKPLYRLVENIIFTYKLFSHDVDVKTLQKLCVTHLYMKFANFDPDKGAKSFSYYGTIAKHYLQNRKKDLDDLKSVNLSWDDHKEEAESKESYEIDAPDERNEIYEFFEFIAEEFEEEVEKKEMSENDLKVINAILVVFEDKENFADKSQNRASIHDRIREEARLDKRDVSYSIGRIKKRYEQKKIEYYRKKNA